MVKRIELDDGTIIYKNENEKFHREDGPAVVYPNGTEYWFKNGKRHREDGPAVIYPDGKEYWYKNGVIHREDGPAVIYPNGEQYWYLHDSEYSLKDWLQLVNISDEEKMELILRYS